MIYLDNAATTQIEKRVLDEMLPFFTISYGNPSSKHTLGFRSLKFINQARQTIADTINAEPHQIIFTSGGTESNNIVLDNFNNIICSEIEHHSVLNHKNIKDYIKVDAEGRCIFHNYTPADYDLASIMYVNNEIGTIQDIKEITRMCHLNDTKIHVDGVQAYGHMPIDVKDLDIDFMSVSGHKFGAPKGIGFIYAKEPQDLLKNTMAGGQQEFGIRPGTENVPYIWGLGIACSVAKSTLSRNIKLYKALKKRFCEEISEISDISINANKYSADNIINIKIKDISATQLVDYLNENEVAVSSGSACDSNNSEPSHVLRAIGLTEDEANSCIRISFNPHNTYAEIETCVLLIKEFIEISREVQERDRSQRPIDREETSQE